MRLFFSKRGFNVSAIDASDIGLKKLEQRAKEENLNINTFCQDLNTWESNKKYDVIVAAVQHDKFKNMKEADFKKWANKDAIFVDIKGVFKHIIKDLKKAYPEANFWVEITKIKPPINHNVKEVCYRLGSK